MKREKMEITRLDKLNFDKTKNSIKELLRDAMCISFPEAIINEDYYEEKISKLEEYILNDSAIVYLAVEDNDVLGWIWCHSINRFDKKRLHVASFAVSKKMRNQGVGSLLMEEAEGYAKKSNYDGMDLFVTENNITAVNFYQKNGYQIERYLLKKDIH